MALTAKEPDGGDFTPAPEGHHLARCFRVIDLGTQFNATFQTKSRQALICFELCNTQMEDGQPFTVCKRYTVSLHKKSNLRRDLEAWRGRAFTDQELSGFDLEKVLGSYAYLIITHKEKAGRVFSNITNVSMVPPNTEKPQGVNPPVCFSLETFNRQVFDQLSEGLRKVIMDSEEMAQGHTGTHQNPNATPQTTTHYAQTQPETPDSEADFSDDIPF